MCHSHRFRKLCPWRGSGLWWSVLLCRRAPVSAVQNSCSHGFKPPPTINTSGIFTSRKVKLNFCCLNTLSLESNNVKCVQEGRLVFAESVMLDQSFGNRQGWKQIFFWVKRSNLHEHGCKKCTLGSKNQLILSEILSKQVPKEEKSRNIILWKMIWNCELHWSYSLPYIHALNIGIFNEKKEKMKLRAVRKRGNRWLHTG